MSHNGGLRVRQVTPPRRKLRTTSVSVVYSETWAPTNADIAKLNGTYMRHLRIICGMLPLRTDENGELNWITPAQHAVLIRIRMPALADICRQHRLRLYGQQIRQPDNTALTWAQATTPGLDRRGATKTQWATLVEQDLAALNLTPDDAHDLENWEQRTKARPPPLVRADLHQQPPAPR